ncbi:MAG: class I SAM-dependent methyltransferase [Nitrospiraceae bacterium]
MIDAGRGVKQCRRCGLLTKDPRPAAEELLRWYQRDYWTCYEGEQRGTARYNLYHHVLNRLQQASPRTGTVVDVGCGMGAFLTQCRERGWYGIGFDPSGSAVARARAEGHEAYECAWPPCRLTDESVDAVIFLNVLDHLPSPFAALREAWRVLRQGGWLYVRVPNGPLHLKLARLLALGGCEDVTIMHLYGFGRRALRHHVPRAGFDQVMIQTAPPSQGDAYGRRDDPARWRIRPLLKRLDRLAYRMSVGCGLHHMGWGPSLEVTATKKVRCG